jgi:hypothetical protein
LQSTATQIEFSPIEFNPTFYRLRYAPPLASSLPNSQIEIQLEGKNKKPILFLLNNFFKLLLEKFLFFQFEIKGDRTLLLNTCAICCRVICGKKIVLKIDI